MNNIDIENIITNTPVLYRSFLIDFIIKLVRGVNFDKLTLYWNSPTYEIANNAENIATNVLKNTCNIDSEYIHTRLELADRIAVELSKYLVVNQNIDSKSLLLKLRMKPLNLA